MQAAYNISEFQAEAVSFVKRLTPLPNRATVVGLYGELGSGKTTFVQSAAKALGVSETVNSPTFLIWKRFKIEDLRFKFLIHVDAYRLENSEELRKLRFEELLRDPRHLIFVEWADRVADILPEDHAAIHFEFVDSVTRKISPQFF